MARVRFLSGLPVEIIESQPALPSVWTRFLLEGFGKAVSTRIRMANEGQHIPRLRFGLQSEGRLAHHLRPGRWFAPRVPTHGHWAYVADLDRPSVPIA